MPKETQTTLYPSQINTKTIACRISAQDYVTFLKEAITKGITINDWLLMKIYDSNLGIGNAAPLNVDESFFKGDLEEILSFIEKEVNEPNNNEPFASDVLNNIIEYDKENGIELKSSKGIIGVLDGLMQNINCQHEIARTFQKKLREKRVPNINDIKAQILTLSQAKFTDRKELKNFMFDVNELLGELG